MKKIRAKIDKARARGSLICSIRAEGCEITCVTRDATEAVRRWGWRQDLREGRAIWQCPSCQRYVNIVKQEVARKKREG